MTLFWILAILTVPAALMVVLSRNPVYSALALVFTLFQVAIMFIGLEAYVIAFLQVIIYAGAIMVLILFAIMLLNLQREERAVGSSGVRVGGWILAVALAAELALVARLHAPASTAKGPSNFGSIEQIAEQLFTAHLLPFELTSLLLLVAVVGAVVLARRRS